MAYHQFELFYEYVQKIHHSWSEKMIIDFTISKIQIEISRTLEIGSDRKIGFSSKWTILDTSRDVLEPPFSTKLIDFQNFNCMNTSKQSIGDGNNALNQLLHPIWENILDISHLSKTQNVPCYIGHVICHILYGALSMDNLNGINAQ